MRSAEGGPPLRADRAVLEVPAGRGSPTLDGRAGQPPWPGRGAGAFGSGASDNQQSAVVRVGVGQGGRHWLRACGVVPWSTPPLGQICTLRQLAAFWHGRSCGGSGYEGFAGCQDATPIACEDLQWFQ